VGNIWEISVFSALYYCESKISLRDGCEGGGPNNVYTCK
jgi:hypothetical protein